MAEAFAALGIAANIAQFLEYTRQLISGGKEIYSSLQGARDEHQALKLIIDDIKNLNQESQPANSSAQPSTDEIGFRKLAAECEPLADKLLAILKDLEVPNDVRFRGLQTVRQTFRGAGKKKDIQDLQRRIADIDVRLRERASMMLRKKHYSGTMSAINSITQANERLGVKTDLTLEKLKEDLISTLGRHSDGVAKEQQASFDNFSKQLFAFVKEGQLVTHQQIILQTLLFEEMEQREETIKDAHKATLDWMFEKEEVKFMKWLETEKGIYWVKGKAGSGKSTLMKYVYNHKTTGRTLRCWAGAEKLFTASFFFWNSGYPMQKSQVGLLQSLLYQVLRACPTLILEVCPSKGPRESWKRKELFEALEKVSKQTTLPAKFCFFVDGLDEYEGDDEDIITLLQDLASSPSVKICVSSRPWNAFLDAFDDSEWKLVLEDLTRDDLRKYVHTMLVQNETFSQMSSHDPRCETLVPQIAEKAQGVWLWVFLVVRDLLRDLKGEEEFPLLQRRLDSFPDELEKYFEDILNRIDKIHQEETARIFLIAVTALQPFPLLSLQYLSMEAADTDYAIQMELSRLSTWEAFQLRQKWKKRLNTRCRDLLEVDQACIWEDLPFLDGRVDFLHRTVRDFLRDNYHDELRRRAGVGFDARASLCKTIVALTKVLADTALKVPADMSLPAYPPPVPNFELADEMLLYAKDFERTEGRSLANLLDEFDRVNTVRCNGNGVHWTNERKQRHPRSGREFLFEEHQSCTFPALAIQAGLRLYLNEELELNKALITQKRGRPLLDYACRPKRTSRILSHLGHEDFFDPQIVRLLLEHGSDPNQPIKGNGDGHTVWGLFIFHCYTTCKGSQPSAHVRLRRTKEMWYEAIESMIDHGASPEVEVQTSEREMPMINMRTMLYSIFGNDKAARLFLRMQEVEQRCRPQTSIFWRLLGWT